MKRTLLASAAALALLGAAPAPSYHLVNSTTLGGDTFWDCVYHDGANRHVFIAHGSHVVVIDSKTYAVVGDIPDTPGVHCIAVGSGKGFVTAGGANKVVVFDPKTLSVTGSIAVGERPDAILYEPRTRRVFTFNAGSRNATVIDAASGTVDGSIPLGGKPEFAVADGQGRIYDNIEDTSEIVEIDAKNMEVLRRFPLAPCTEPSGLAIDTAHHRVFAACDNEMMAALDTVSGKVVATVPTGKGADGAAYDAKRHEVLIPNGEGKLSIIHQDTADKYHLVANVKTQFGVRTLDFDPATHRIFSATADLTPDPGKRPPYKMTPGSFRALVYGR
jgi:YVTN family beta-propeller protein